MLVGVLAGVEVSGRQLVAGGRLQLELLSAGGSQVVRLRVEVESPGDGQGSDDLIRVFKAGGPSPFGDPTMRTDGNIVNRAVHRTDLGRGDKSVSGWVGVVPGSEVSVEGRHDGVLLSLLHVLPEERHTGCFEVVA